MCWINLAQKPPTEQDGTVLGPESVDPRFNFRSEVPHQALNWPRGGIPESTDCPTLDLLAVQREPMDG
jgi:hypothetical protein